MKNKNLIRRSLMLISVSSALLMTACMTTEYPQANELVAPLPIDGNTGAYMCPYTSDDTVCAWVEKGRKAKMGSQVGSALGAFAGQKALEQVPFAGAFLGQKVGDSVGRKIAMESMGGEEAIIAGSDLSFDNVNDLAVYLYVEHSDHPDYAEVVGLLGELYPDYKKGAHVAIMKAPRVEVATPIGG